MKLLESPGLGVFSRVDAGVDVDGGGKCCAFQGGASLKPGAGNLMPGALGWGGMAVDVNKESGEEAGGTSAGPSPYVPGS